MRRPLAAVLSPLSKSTNTSDGHKRRCSSSRVTTSPGRSTSASSTCNGFPWSLSLTPRFRSSPVLASSSKTPNRRSLRALRVPLPASVDITKTPKYCERASTYHCKGKVASPHCHDFGPWARAIREVGPADGRLARIERLSLAETSRWSESEIFPWGGGKLPCLSTLWQKPTRTAHLGCALERCSTPPFH